MEEKVTENLIYNILIVLRKFLNVNFMAKILKF